MAIIWIPFQSGIKSVALGVNCRRIDSVTVVGLGGSTSFFTFPSLHSQISADEINWVKDGWTHVEIHGGCNANRWAQFPV